MAIFSRIARLCRADLHGVMDQIEDRGLLLKQYLREMEQALTDKDARIVRIKQRRGRLQHEHDRYCAQAAELDRDVTAAVANGNDDIARVLIRKLKPLMTHRDGVVHHIQGLDQKIGQLKKTLAQQQLQYDQLKLEADAYIDRPDRDQNPNDTVSCTPAPPAGEPTCEEVELELIKRKEALAQTAPQTT